MNTTAPKKYKRVRTMADIMADPRVGKRPGDIWREWDGGFVTPIRFQECRSYWVVLVDGFNYEGSSALHAPTVAKLCDALNYRVEPGPSY